MQVNLGTALFTLALWALCCPAWGTEGKQKLQIGVKKRVDNCSVKSRKGDVLHMHYTVSVECRGRAATHCDREALRLNRDLNPVPKPLSVWLGNRR